MDDAFAARAAPNMSDGSFNPRLSLQQSTDFEAQREAAGLQRRLERGLVSERGSFHRLHDMLVGVCVRQQRRVEPQGGGQTAGVACTSA